MQKAVNLLVRRDDMTHEEFVEYWLEEHAPMAESLPGVYRYTTSIPNDPERSAYDGIAELYLAEGTSAGAVFSTEAGERVQADTENFLDNDASEFIVLTETIQFDTSE